MKKNWVKMNGATSLPLVITYIFSLCSQADVSNGTRHSKLWHLSKQRVHYLQVGPLHCNCVSKYALFHFIFGSFWWERGAYWHGVNGRHHGETQVYVNVKASTAVFDDGKTAASIIIWNILGNIMPWWIKVIKCSRVNFIICYRIQLCGRDIRVYEIL